MLVTRVQRLQLYPDGTNAHQQIGVERLETTPEAEAEKVIEQGQADDKVHSVEALRTFKIKKHFLIRGKKHFFAFLLNPA